MFVWPLLRNRFAVCKSIPAPLVVLLVAVPMGMGFDLLHKHSYMLQGQKYPAQRTVSCCDADRVFGMFDEITFPDFSALLAAEGLEVGLHVSDDRHPGVGAQRKGDRPDRPLEAQDQPESRHHGRRRCQPARGARGRPADDLGNRPQPRQHRQRRPHTVCQFLARRVSAGLRGTDSRAACTRFPWPRWRRC